MIEAGEDVVRRLRAKAAEPAALMERAEQLGAAVDETVLQRIVRLLKQSDDLDRLSRHWGPGSAWGRCTGERWSASCKPRKGTREVVTLDGRPTISRRKGSNREGRGGPMRVGRRPSARRPCGRHLDRSPLVRPEVTGPTST
jgi:hypothetical protein